MGKPFFDGRMDKGRLLVDVYMSGLLATLAVAAKRLKTRDPGEPRIETLEPALQLDIAKLVQASYGIDPLKQDDEEEHHQAR
jgi:hypothetical protein